MVSSRAGVRTGDSFALEELGRVFLLDHREKAADACLARAVQEGAPAEAPLLHAEVLLAKGRYEDPMGEMQTFLGKRKPKERSLQTRMLWAQMQAQAELEAPGARAPL